MPITKAIIVPSAKKETLTQEQIEYQEQTQQENKLLNNMLTAALQYADKYKLSAVFEKKLLHGWGADFEGEANIRLKYGHLFSAEKKHLVVIREPWPLVGYVDVFELRNSKFVKVQSLARDGCDFHGYFIKDINGDGQKDLVTHWYPTSGCCRRDVYDVYLYQKSKEIFTEQYEFMNPTFSPSEKTIRGVDYGHPGDVRLYKYKWNGLKLDTIEYIFPDTTGKKYYVTKTPEFGRSGKVLTAVPKEYHKIESYDWFMGKY